MIRYVKRINSIRLDVFIPPDFSSCHTVRLHKISFGLNLEIEIATAKDEKIKSPRLSLFY